MKNLKFITRQAYPPLLEHQHRVNELKLSVFIPTLAHRPVDENKLKALKHHLSEEIENCGEECPLWLQSRMRSFLENFSPDPELLNKIGGIAGFYSAQHAQFLVTPLELPDSHPKIEVSSTFNLNGLGRNLVFFEYTFFFVLTDEERTQIFQFTPLGLELVPMEKPFETLQEEKNKERIFRKIEKTILSLDDPSSHIVFISHPSPLPPDTGLKLVYTPLNPAWFEDRRYYKIFSNLDYHFIKRSLPDATAKKTA